MLTTLEAMQRYFQHRFQELFSKSTLHHLSKTNTFDTLGDTHFWSVYAKQVLTNTPLIKHDVTAMRLQTYALGFKQLGLTQADAMHEAEKAMTHFSLHRNNVTIADNIHQLLSYLTKNYALIAISNGNVCTKSIGLSHYFQHTLHAEKGLKQKPHCDLFQLACQKLALQPKQILHVGDCGYADILGARRAGFHSAWLNCYDVGKPINVLPDIELNQVTDLARLF